MTKAALFMHPAGFNTTMRRILGRQSPGERFRRGFIRAANVEQLHVGNTAAASIEDLQAHVARIQPAGRPQRWILADKRPGLAPSACCIFQAPISARKPALGEGAGPTPTP